MGRRCARSAKVAGRLSAVVALCLYVAFGAPAQARGTTGQADPADQASASKGHAWGHEALPPGDTDPAIEVEPAPESSTFPDAGDLTAPESTEVPQPTPDAEPAPAPEPTGVIADDPSEDSAAAAAPATSTSPEGTVSADSIVTANAAPQEAADPPPDPTLSADAPLDDVAVVAPSGADTAPARATGPALAVVPQPKAIAASTATVSSAGIGERSPRPVAVAAVQAMRPIARDKASNVVQLFHGPIGGAPRANLFEVAASTALPSAGLAIAPRLPNAIAVAVEFGRAGNGWAGALVFNVWLRREMRERRMSQRQLAHLSGVNHSTVSRILSDGRAPSLETATKLAHALRLDWSDEKIAAYFDILAERTIPPTQRVETALRGDPNLGEDDIRALMTAYLMRRGRPRVGRRVP